MPPPRTLAARGRRWAADLWVVAPSCHWLLGLALLHGGVCISCGALQLAAGQPDGELAEDGSDAWLLSDTDATQLTQATLRICALALVLGGMCVGAMVAVGLAYEAPHELYAAAALGVWLTLTALLMPTDAADHPSHLPLALALLLLGLSLATLDACRRVHRSFGWRGLKRFGASRVAGACRAVGVQAWPLLQVDAFFSLSMCFATAMLPLEPTGRAVAVALLLSTLLWQAGVALALASLRRLCRHGTAGAPRPAAPGALSSAWLSASALRLVLQLQLPLGLPALAFHAAAAAAVCAAPAPPEPRVAAAYVTLCVAASAARLGLAASLARLRAVACASPGLLSPAGCDGDPTLASLRESARLRHAVRRMQRGAAVTLYDAAADARPRRVWLQLGEDGTTLRWGWKEQLDLERLTAMRAPKPQRAARRGSGGGGGSERLTAEATLVASSAELQGDEVPVTIERSRSLVRDGTEVLRAAEETEAGGSSFRSSEASVGDASPAPPRIHAPPLARSRGSGGGGSAAACQLKLLSGFLTDGCSPPNSPRA